VIRGRLETFLALLVRRRGERFVEEVVREVERRPTPPSAKDERQIKDWARRLGG
jgi:hypothetical protein